jgi:hypothetical protein
MSVMLGVMPNESRRNCSCSKEITWCIMGNFLTTVYILYIHTDVISLE